jgi:hypothetical protein
VTSTLSLTDRPRRHPDSSFREIGDEGGLVVLPGKAQVKVLNPVGIRVFSMLDGSRTVDEISARIAEEFDVSAETARKDVLDFLSDLTEHGMLGGE